MDQQTAYRRSKEGTTDRVRFWRESRLDNLECLKACFRRHRYLPHLHDTYAIGVILAGAEIFRYRGSENVAGPGQVVCVNPCELHDGRPVHDGFAYRMVYPSVPLVRDIACDVFEREVAAPMFDEAVMEDPDLAIRFVRLHGLMERRAAKLGIDELLTEAIALMIRRHGHQPAPFPCQGRESGPVARAREAIDDVPGADFGLEKLAQIAGLSRFHLIRSFRREVGVTPHTYLVGRRVARAKDLLAGSSPLSEVALACGFYDQSHFSRTFKAWSGVTPGQYRQGSNFLQDQAA